MKTKPEKRMQEQSGIFDISDAWFLDEGQKLFIALENCKERIIGWCNARVSKDDAPLRLPIYNLNGKPFPHIMAEGDYIA